MSSSNPPSLQSEIIARYRSAFELHGISVESLLYRDGRQDLRYGALTRSWPLAGGYSVLDFGCGLGHLRSYLDEPFGPIQYTGVDIVPEFVDAARELHGGQPGTSFELVDSVEQLDGTWDMIVASGTFNLQYEVDPVQNREYLADTLVGLFGHAVCSLSVDFMSEYVDFQHESAHHQQIDQLVALSVQRMSRRFVLDQSYLPYEFAFTVFTDQQVGADAGLYRHPLSSPA